ncbi:MAG TPA: hypothetical protein VKB88_37270 [Bryobacteraceae bacterium]|nr:hypothetical protein [Bryobacteraceae bacterium]
MGIKFLGLVLGGVALPGLGQSGSASVDVYMSGRDDSFQLLRSGRPLASEIFAKIGIHLNWHTGELPEGQKAFGISTVERAPESAGPDALAASRLSDSAGVEITMYRDRLHLFLNAHSRPPGSAAAYVLAHELAHAMQGIARHSATGIMKAHWSDSDFREMVFHKLAFTPYDIELIHRGLAERVAAMSLERDQSRTVRK